MNEVSFINMLRARKYFHEEAIAAIDLLLTVEAADPENGQIPLSLENGAEPQAEQPKKKQRRPRGGKDSASLGSRAKINEMVQQVKDYVLPSLEETFTAQDALPVIRQSVDPTLNRKQISNLMLACSRRGLIHTTYYHSHIWAKGPKTSKK